ncbi:DNA binding protein [Bifidobacterium animalis subsp. lactis DSM 10140]|nr:DNA binding protein [Bifidobacterium animalis subsp. lactis DSM 10140]
MEQMTMVNEQVEVIG